jgi:hypothetical protein
MTLNAFVISAFFFKLRAVISSFYLKREATFAANFYKKTANRFFGDLNQILVEHLILQVCRITDPEETSGKKNLTIEFFINNSNFSNTDKELQELQRLAASIHMFREKIVTARNKLISHFDRSSVLAGKTLGGTNQELWDAFWRDLEEFINILYKRYVDPNGNFHLSEIALLSDADSLVKAIKESTYFWALWKDKETAWECADVAFGSKYSEA